MATSPVASTELGSQEQEGSRAVTARGSHVCTRPPSLAGLLPGPHVQPRGSEFSAAGPACRAALIGPLPHWATWAAERRGAWEALGGQSTCLFERPWAVVTGLSSPAAPSSWLCRQARGVRKNQCFLISLFS